MAAPPTRRGQVEALVRFLSDWAGLEVGRRRANLLPVLEERWGPEVHPDAVVEAVRADSVLLDRVVSAVTVGESYFFRDSKQMSILRRRIMPALAERPGTIRVWSAGCSTGEEAYTLAILLNEAGILGRSRLVATDISTSFVRAARKGAFTRWSLRATDEAVRRKYFSRRGSRFRLREELRSTVGFGVANLLDLAAGHAAPVGTFDLILCRNVLIYLHATAARRVTERLLSSLTADGWLMLAPADPLLSHMGVPARVEATDAGLLYRPLRDRDRTPEGTMSVQRGGPRRDDPAGSGPPASSATAKGPETAPSREPLRGAPRDRSTTPEAGGTREDVGELVRRIRELADKGETREAVRTAAAAAERHPSRAEPQHLLSLALLEEGRPEDALKAVRACIYLDAEHGPAYLTLGAVHLKLGHRHAATRAFAEATRRGHDAPAAV